MLVILNTHSDATQTLAQTHTPTQAQQQTHAHTQEHTEFCQRKHKIAHMCTDHWSNASITCDEFCDEFWWVLMSFMRLDDVDEFHQGIERTRKWAKTDRFGRDEFGDEFWWVLMSFNEWGLLCGFRHLYTGLYELTSVLVCVQTDTLRFTQMHSFFCACSDMYTQMHSFFVKGLCVQIYIHILFESCHSYVCFQKDICRQVCMWACMWLCSDPHTHENRLCNIVSCSNL